MHRLGNEMDKKLSIILRNFNGLVTEQCDEGCKVRNKHLAPEGNAVAPVLVEHFLHQQFTAIKPIVSLAW